MTVFITPLGPTRHGARFAGLSVPGAVISSLRLIGPAGGAATLLATAARIEQAIR